MISLKNKKVLVMGLGILGGGVASAKWLMRQGAKVTVTDLKTRKELAPSIKALGPVAKKIRFVLGGHREEDFRTHDFVVVNPGVPKESTYLKIAKQGRPSTPRQLAGRSGNNGVRIINDAVLFFEFLPKENPIIAVTGTRGKTTTANWIAHFLRARWPNVQVAGNTPENPLLKELERIEAPHKWIPGQARNDNATPVVVELSSWQLEYLPEARRAPDVAVITNLYPDHLNRYSSMEEYALAKANIFKNQTEKQFLILNKENEWTEWFLKQNPKAQVCYTSSSPLDISTFQNIHIGEHNIQNLQAASLAANLMGISWEDMRPLISSLPSVPFRQEVIFENDKLLIINDSASTSPEAGIAALRRFFPEAKRRGVPFFFIAGGTDKGLSYEKWAEEVLQARPILFLLEGSATAKMEKDLTRRSLAVARDPHNINLAHARDVVGFKDLETIIKDLKKKIGEAGGVVVFSPGAASFEKFKNEFDRGERFSLLAKKYLVV